MIAMYDQSKAKRVSEVLDAAEADGVIVFMNHENHIVAAGSNASRWAPALRPHHPVLRQMLLQSKLESMKLFARIRSKQP